MNVRSDDALIQVGVIGLGRRGLFLLERWSAGDPIRVVAACDTNPQARAVASPLCGQVVGDAGSLLSRDDVDAVLIAVPIFERFVLAQRVLEAGKAAVFADPPIAADAEQAAGLFEIADRRGGRIAIWSPWREDSDFLAAEATVRSGSLGPLTFLRYERWNAAGDEERGAPAVEAGLSRSLVYLLDQLLALTDAAPERVAARSFGRGVTAIIEFADGPTATVTLSMRAATNLDAGWAIDAARGGYAGGRRWVRTDDGEVYDLPVERPAPPTLEGLLRSLADGLPLAETAVPARRLINLIDACERSLRSEQWEAAIPSPA